MDSRVVGDGSAVCIQRKNLMARSYFKEMNELADTLEYVIQTDITNLKMAIRSIWHTPLCAIGSGGSLSAAHAFVRLHRHFTGNSAFMSTPFDIQSEPLRQDSSVWLISTGGQNVDIMSAGETLKLRAPQYLGLLTSMTESPLTELLENHCPLGIHVFNPPRGKDGFLATNSLLTFVLALTRAYGEVSETNVTNSKLIRASIDALLDEAGQEQMREQVAPLWKLPVTVVLHGTATSLGAVDLESKFTEAALGVCQLADFRNFAHGRHHWLAKHANESGVLALVSMKDRSYADRTLALLPRSIPSARVDIPGHFPNSLIRSLLTAFLITSFAGETKGINPGRPGVPEFGRKLYGLRVPATKKVSVDNDMYIIARKLGRSVGELAHLGNEQPWRIALTDFRTKLTATRFSAIILDFDGTIVDTFARRKPITPAIAERLAAIAERAVLGIATGRGRSARTELQEALPDRLWPNVIIGYYNGSVIDSLDNNVSPAPSRHPGPALGPIANAIDNDLWLTQNTNREYRTTQLTLDAHLGVSAEEVWTRASEIARISSDSASKVLLSGHSVDIVEAGTSKLELYESIQALYGSDVLAIGDRGAWPGNDSELLSTPFALSVDECNLDPSTCWPLAPGGRRGPNALSWILDRLLREQGQLRFGAE